VPGIEFVGTDADDDPDDEVLAGGAGPRRPWPRWVWVLAGLLVVAVVIGAVVSRSADAPDAAPSRTPSPSIGRGGTASVTAGPDQPAPGTRIAALTSDGTSLFWLAGTRLYRAGPDGRPTVSAALSPAGAGFAELQLVADPAERTIWVVSRGAGASPAVSGIVEGFAAADLSSVTRAPVDSLVSGAAVLDGALYVLAAGRLLRITTDAAGFTPVATVDETARDLLAAGGNLLYVEGGNGSAIGLWAPSGVRTPTVLHTVGNALAVAGSTVFVLGTTPDQLSELDTLAIPSRKVQRQALATGLDGSLQLVAAGARAVIVRGIGLRGDELACVTTADLVDAPGPATVQALAVSTSTAVTVLGDQVFQADGGAVRPVTFNVGRCST
jgi:hypothetical protein